MSFNNNPNNSFRYDVYVPDVETEPLYNAFNIDNMKEKFNVSPQYETINGQYSLDNLNVSNHSEYIKRLERLENNNKDDNLFSTKNYDDDDDIKYQKQYLNYLVNNKRYKNNVNNNKNIINKSIDYFYIFLIIILFIITLFQKNRIDNLNDLLSFKLNNIQPIISTKGL
jgi:hypothetical protein